MERGLNSEGGCVHTWGEKKEVSADRSFWAAGPEIELVNGALTSRGGVNEVPER